MLELTGAEWVREAPASEAALRALRAAYPTLPESYFVLIGESNGGEGELSIEPLWFSLWPAEEVAEANKGYGVHDFLPGFIGIGSNGGGELLVFSAEGRLYSVPAVGLEEEDLLPVADTIEGFVAAMGRRGPEEGSDS